MEKNNIYIRHLNSQEEIIKSMKESSVPSVLYKYRSWRNRNHQRALTDQEIWFSHPKGLNDPFDIRVPYKFDLSEIEDPRFYEKLRQICRDRNPHIPFNSRDFNIICQNQMQLIRKDPAAYFEENLRAIRNGNLYDWMGVFSLTQDPADEAMWAYYGENQEGFCIGYDSVELVKQLNVSFGVVNYSDEPIKHSFINENEFSLLDIFQKSTKWSNEKEYRFVTAQIRKESDRKAILKKGCLKHLILGARICQKSSNEIIQILKEVYEGSVKLFQIVEKTDSYGLTLKEKKY
ncbi:MAG: DUF2971 domain-containing protein [Flavisolibacter sp.]